MDWYFDIIAILGTFCVIAIGMTIYARLNPTRPRVGRSHYIYTGIIPTITISAADSSKKSSPTTLTPADSVEEDDSKPKTSESPVDNAELAQKLKNDENNHLTVPISDDEDEDEEEQQQTVQLEDICVPVSLPVVENKNKSQPINLTSSSVEKIDKDKDCSQATSGKSKSNEDTIKVSSEIVDPVENLIEDVKESKTIDKENSKVSSKTVKNITEPVVNLVEDVKESEKNSEITLPFDKSDDEEHSQSASLSAADNIEDDKSESMDLSDMIATLDDFRSSPIPNKDDNATGTYSADSNKSLRKIGTSHTVEEPLFPFSEILEEENPSTRNRFKKRLSQ